MKHFFHLFSKLGVSLLIIFFIAILLTPAFAQVTWLVDFGNDTAKTVSPDNFGRTWNNVTQVNSSGVENLVSTEGAKSGVQLHLSATKGALLFNPWGAATSATAAPGDLNVGSAARDWISVNSANEARITLSNLPTQAHLRLTFFASFPSDQTRTTRYDVSGNQTTTCYLQTSGLNLALAEPTNANQSQFARVDDIMPSAAGLLHIDIKRHSGDTGYLGILKVEVLNELNFPPSAESLAISGTKKANTSIVGRYVYFDREGNEELNTEIYWEKTNSPFVTTPNVFVAATGNPVLSLTTRDIGFYYRFCVLPRAGSGNNVNQANKTAWIGPVSPSTVISSFHVGSSFTQWPNIPKQFENLCVAAGMPASAQWQVTSGKNLMYHWDNGLNGVLGAGIYSRHEIPTDSYNVFVIQPYNDEWQTANVARATDYCGRFYRLANPTTCQVYLYQGWPWLSQPITTQNNINNAFEQIRASISLNSNRPALIIPAGQVVRAILDDAENGVLKNYNTNGSLSRTNFYIDNLHLGNLGAYAVALTHYATITKRSPVGLPYTALDANFYNDNVVSFNSAIAARIQQIVWDVVSSYPNALAVNSSQSIPPWGTTISPPIVVEPDPPFVTESTVPSDPLLLSQAFGAAGQGATAILGNLPRTLPPADDGFFVAEYTLNPLAESNGVVYTPHWSYDLKRWTTTQPANTVITRTENTVRISWPNTSRWRFLRIHVVQPAQ